MNQIPDLGKTVRLRVVRIGNMGRIFAACAVAFACIMPPVLSGAALVLSADGLTVYDATNNITWLADFNLAASRFGLPVCSGSSIDTEDVRESERIYEIPGRGCLGRGHEHRQLSGA